MIWTLINTILAFLAILLACGSLGWQITSYYKARQERIRGNLSLTAVPISRGKNALALKLEIWNDGHVPVYVKSVSLGWRTHDSRCRPTTMQLMFQPSPDKQGPLQPGQPRTFLLPNFPEGFLEAPSKQSPTTLSISVKSAKREVLRIKGDEVRPLLLELVKNQPKKVKPHSGDTKVEQKPNNPGEKHELPPEKKTHLLSQLANVISLHNDEHQTWLSVFFASLTTNALLFIALFTTGNFPKNRLIIILIALFGFSMTWLLRRVQARAQKYMEAYEHLAEKLETDLLLGEYAYTENLRKWVQVPGKRARPRMAACNLAIMIFWILTAYLTFAKILLDLTT